MIFEKPPPGRMVLFGAFFLATTFCHNYCMFQWIWVGLKLYPGPLNGTNGVFTYRFTPVNYPIEWTWDGDSTKPLQSWESKGTPPTPPRPRKYKGLLTTYVPLFGLIRALFLGGSIGVP